MLLVGGEQRTITMWCDIRSKNHEGLQKGCLRPCSMRSGCFSAADCWWFPMTQTDDLALPQGLGHSHPLPAVICLPCMFVCSSLVPDLCYGLIVYFKLEGVSKHQDLMGL